ncbi:uncharacterized protein CC84DRAFT_800934 [Paraphaeosphaeria sporulosa]|uniref:Uncharacterized protein n=1 Tax=Paraphaeosphaeria sporulosa TaxID=1460663 RepID=A0A177CAD1_9PLEO|nr:uncharacterized protein CC84DRAFT_800934 [Paraphaeosphaeria sporulosa]OAG04704.1 hypothetical protein CC84DRAFT_800934 [Paraphaeosphaeria sporulosa]
MVSILVSQTHVIHVAAPIDFASSHRHCRFFSSTHTKYWYSSHSFSLAGRVSGGVFAADSLLLRLDERVYTMDSYTCTHTATAPLACDALLYTNANNLSVLRRNSADHAFVKVTNQNGETRLGRTHAWRLKIQRSGLARSGKTTIGLTRRSTFAITLMSARKSAFGFP